MARYENGTIVTDGCGCGSGYNPCESCTGNPYGVNYGGYGSGCGCHESAPAGCGCENSGVSPVNTRNGFENTPETDCGCGNSGNNSAGNNSGCGCGQNVLKCAACGLTDTIFRIVRGLDRTLSGFGNGCGCGCGRS